MPSCHAAPQCVVVYSPPEHCHIAAGKFDIHAHVAGILIIKCSQMLGPGHKLTSNTLLQLYASATQCHACSQNDVFKGLPTMALTATATNKVIDDVIKSLKIARCKRFQVIIMPRQTKQLLHYVNTSFQHVDVQQLLRHNVSCVHSCCC